MDFNNVKPEQHRELRAAHGVSSSVHRRVYGPVALQTLHRSVIHASYHLPSGMYA
jgi:hypothetical protein